MIIKRVQYLLAKPIAALFPDKSAIVDYGKTTIYIPESCAQVRYTWRILRQSYRDTMLIDSIDCEGVDGILWNCISRTIKAVADEYSCCQVQIAPTIHLPADVESVLYKHDIKRVTHDDAGQEGTAQN